MNLQSATIGVSFALFIVWMERQGRWVLFAQAAAGDYVLTGTRSTGPKATAGPSSGAGAGKTPSTTTTQPPAVPPGFVGQPPVNVPPAFAPTP